MFRNNSLGFYACGPPAGRRVVEKYVRKVYHHSLRRVTQSSTKEPQMGMCMHILIVIVLILVPVSALPINLACSRSITSGKIMGETVIIGSTKQIKLAKDGIPIECGSTLQAGDTGLTFVKDISTGEQYGIRAIMLLRHSFYFCSFDVFQST